MLDRQREVVTAFARAEGYALAQIVTDRWDGFTISQILDAARLHEARLVIVPAGTTLATSHARLAHQLEPAGATCVVIPDAAGARDGLGVMPAPATPVVEPGTATSAPRLSGPLGRHSLQPRHAARTHS
ncbi:hypothetical protein [Myceligenerans halotolerans]